MITRIQLIRNVGQFDSVAPAPNLQLAPLTLVYAENGRGKTTLAAILRSLATGDPIPIAERRRLAAQNFPHVVVEASGGPPLAVFENNAWNQTIPNIAVFDDMFVDENVYSGLAVGSDQRQNLHELILGAQGVALNERLQQFVDQIEVHNTALRTKGAAIPASERGSLSVDEFCDLTARADIDGAIQAAERTLAAVKEQEPVRATAPFDALTLPAFDVAAIERLLQRDLPELDATAVARVQAHLAGIGRNGEAWVADGMERMSQVPVAGICPFCAQDLRGSPVIGHYRAYFSAAYATLKRNVADTLAAIDRTHSDQVPATFERAVRFASERRQFWSRFCDIPAISIDTAAIALDWRAARDAALAQLNAKQGAPLERMSLTNQARAALAGYETHRQSVATLNQQLQAANAAIRTVKEQAARGDVTASTAAVARLKATKARHAPATAALCADYLREKSAKARTEQLRDQARAQLDQYRTNAFRDYKDAINDLLDRFNAGFRMDRVTPVNTRTGSTCTYNIVINNKPVPVAGGVPAPGTPSFRNTLSSGDRNTLALAFFFASLERDPNLARKIVVIDDPKSSLDEHRALTTVQELRRITQRVSQMIVLSHEKALLCQIWDGADRTTRAALQVARDRAGSTILEWDVNQDCITEHDRRHAALRDYLTRPTPNNREVARSIRHLLEAFFRVAYPECFPPEAKLGVFRNLCQQRLGTAGQVLGADDVRELSELTEYAHRFHHDTNQAWETERINDQELMGFVERALTFTRRRA
jgi:wobble nucleotide-excising tRNase